MADIEDLEKCKKCDQVFVIGEVNAGGKTARAKTCKCGSFFVLPAGENKIPAPAQEKKEAPKPPPRVEGYRVQPIMMVLRCFNPECKGEMQFQNEKVSVGDQTHHRHICSLCASEEMIIDGIFPNIKYQRM